MFVSAESYRPRSVNWLKMALCYFSDKRSHVLEKSRTGLCIMTINEGTRLIGDAGMYCKSTVA